MKRVLFFACFTVAIISHAAQPAKAGYLLSDGGAGNLSGLQSTQEGVVGFDFTVGSQDLRVTRLGVFDLDSLAVGNGLDTSHTVSLWNTSGTVLLGSAIVPAGTSGALVNGFRFVDLATPILLEAGQSYTLGAFFPMSSSIGKDLFRFNSVSQMQAITSGDLSFNQGRIGFGSGFPTITPSNGGYVGPNLEYEIAVPVAAVPEPTTLLSGLIGTLLLGGSSLRRRRTAM